MISGEKIISRAIIIGTDTTMTPVTKANIGVTSIPIATSLSIIGFRAKCIKYINEILSDLNSLTMRLGLLLLSQLFLKNQKFYGNY